MRTPALLLLYSSGRFIMFGKPAGWIDEYFSGTLDDCAGGSCMPARIVLSSYTRTAQYYLTLKTLYNEHYNQNRSCRYPVVSKIFFTIAFDIIESTETLFIVDLGCTIIFPPDQQYRVVARSNIEIKSDEGIGTLQLRIKAEEEMPELEKLINDDIGNHTGDFKISHLAKSSFSIQEIEAAISDALKQGSQ